MPHIFDVVHHPSLCLHHLNDEMIRSTASVLSNCVAVLRATEFTAAVIDRIYISLRLRPSFLQNAGSDFSASRHQWKIGKNLFRLI